MSDDGFEPKLGKIRSTRGKRAARYVGRVLVAARLAGAKTCDQSRRYDGSRIGRGASIGRLLSSRDRFGGLRSRRAIVKIRPARLGKYGLGAARAHLHYIQRDGVTREGAPGELYGRDTDQADGRAFLERCGNDDRQFRVIVSAEDGAEYADLKSYVRRLMAQVEDDLGTRLDWVAVDHFNTERPHTHIVLRGVDDRGENLLIGREYISHGFRERAAELVNLDLGPRTDQEIESRLRHDVSQERLTAIDRRLLRRMDADRTVIALDRDPFQQSVAAGRLRKLAVMGLADDLGGGRWGTPCFDILEACGLWIAPRPGSAGRPRPSAARIAAASEEIVPTDEERTWIEGNPRIATHLKKERSPGLAALKREQFILEHGKLRCERCELDPASVYGDEAGQACIEVHHHRTHVADMQSGHETRLDDLKCLCSNCHRVLHRALSLGLPFEV